MQILKRICNQIYFCLFCEDYEQDNSQKVMYQECEQEITQVNQDYQNDQVDIEMKSFEKNKIYIDQQKKDNESNENQRQILDHDIYGQEEDKQLIMNYEYQQLNSQEKQEQEQEKQMEKKNEERDKSNQLNAENSGWIQDDDIKI